MTSDGRNNVTDGKGSIVLRVTNGYGFSEHSTIAQAKAEAARLAERMGGKYVVYVPVAIVEPMPRTKVTQLVSVQTEGELDNQAHALSNEDPYPF